MVSRPHPLLKNWIYLISYGTITEIWLRLSPYSKLLLLRPPPSRPRKKLIRACNLSKNSTINKFKYTWSTVHCDLLLADVAGCTVTRANFGVTGRVVIAATGWITIVAIGSFVTGLGTNFTLGRKKNNTMTLWAKNQDLAFLHHWNTSSNVFVTELFYLWKLM